MIEHSPSFRQKARSLSSTHGLKTSERRLGCVGASAEERQEETNLVQIEQFYIFFKKILSFFSNLNQQEHFSKLLSCEAANVIQQRFTYL